MTRARLSELPDGSYTCIDYLDNDRADLDRRIAIQATVMIKGSEMYCDFTGSSPQMRGPLNCTLSRGLGGTKIFEATHGDMVVSIRGERYFTQPWGLAGGQPAASAQAWIERADGSIEEIPSKRVFTLASRC
jgi:N-methylhydantoinase B/oxoprolinase/acetone carboxylase alpha subunit